MHFFLTIRRPPQEVPAQFIHIIDNLRREKGVLHIVAWDGREGCLGQNQSACKGKKVSFPTSKTTLHSLNDVSEILGNRNMLNGEPQILPERGGGAKIQNIVESFLGTRRDIGREKNPRFRSADLLTR